MSIKASSTYERALEEADATYELRYFPLNAKGLGPSLVLQHSGLKWSGNRDLPFSIDEHWAALKPTTPFGQLPLLSCPAIGLNLAQTTAIINYIGRVAATEGVQSDEYAMSQMLIAEAEDIYNMMNKFVPTLYKQLSTDSITTSKGTRADYDKFFLELLPAQLEKLEKLSPFVARQQERASGGSSKRVYNFLPGELHLWSMLYQLAMIPVTRGHSHSHTAQAVWLSTATALGAPGSVLLPEKYPKLFDWFILVQEDERTKDVTFGRSPMGELQPYYLHAESVDICKKGDERGRWG